MARTPPDLTKLMRRVRYRFKDVSLLQRALTHSSAADGAGRSTHLDNERLEFLGDRVLGLAIADMLMLAYPEAPEGDLARRFNALVRRETCAAVARDIKLGNYLVLGRSEIRAGGAAKEAILADACEALLAAIYKDGGFDAVKVFIQHAWGERLDRMTEIPRDSKTLLQEWAQARALPHPEYREKERSGPDHAPVFTIEVRIRGFAPETGSGSSKRRAEQAAAHAILVREGVLDKMT